MNEMSHFVYDFNTCTLSPISLSDLSTVSYKITLNTGSVGRAWAAPQSCPLLAEDRPQSFVKYTQNGQYFRQNVMIWLFEKYFGLF